MNEITAMDSDLRSICTFRADGRLYGIEVAHIREVSPHVAAAPVPQAPPAVRGLANLRSRIYLVIDLRPLLGLPPVESTADSRLIILKPVIAEDVGILVDQGGDIVQVERREMDLAAPAPLSRADAAGEPQLPPTCGVCRLERELMVLIDPVAVVSGIAKQIR